jgi:two-component sensor histidine kinase
MPDSIDEILPATDTADLPEDARQRLLLQSLIDKETCLITLDDKGTILDASNIGFAAERIALLEGHISAQPGDEEAVGMPVTQIWATELHPIIDIVFLRAKSSGEDTSLEHTLQDANRNPIHLKLRATTERTDDDRKLVHLAISDLTSLRIRTQQLEVYGRNIQAFNARLRLALRGSRITIFEQDLDLRYTFVANAPEPLADGMVGKNDIEMLGEETGNELHRIKLKLLETGKHWSGRVDVPMGDEMVSYDLQMEPRLSKHGEIVGLIGTAIDLTDLKQHEDAMRLAMREITHRTKNLLAVIQATARRTASRATSVESFLQGFSDRLSAMSQSHDLLVSSNWRGADMAELLWRNARQAGSEREGAFIVEGPAMTLTSEAAQHFGMALHELVSNALKYGGLSTNGGQVHVSWTRAEPQESNEPMGVIFVWKETGGPPVEEPERAGFGTSYLQRAIAMAMNAQTELAFEPDGLRCTIKMPGESFY